MPRYAELNESSIASWFERNDPGGPMWALNMMMATLPADGDAVLPQESGAADDRLMLL